jgi:hypothetical protein
MSTDTSSTIEFLASPTRQLSLLAFSVLSMAIAGALALQLMPGMPSDPMAVSAGYTGIAFFGFCAVVALWRLWAQRGAVVTVSPAGLRDARVTGEPIPWSAIRSISTAQMQRQTVLLIAIDPAAEQHLTITRVARWMREAHRRSGVEGLVVSAHGLRVGYPTLFYACRDYWEAWHKA